MLRVFFGSPGAGKTTLAVKMALKQSKKRNPLYNEVFLNFAHQVPNCRICDLKEIGKWTFPEYSYILVDEAGIEYNNRKFKTFSQSAIEWFKLHRHYSCDVDLFSQSWEDMDITLRRLSTQLWYMVKIGPFTICRRVFKRVTVDKNTHQIIDGYKMAHVLTILCPWLHNWMLTFRPFYYRYFDSWSRPALPVKDFGSPMPSLVRRSTREVCIDLYSRATAAVKSRIASARSRFVRLRDKLKVGRAADRGSHDES